jgi:hypothetical protein
MNKLFSGLFLIIISLSAFYVSSAQKALTDKIKFIDFYYENASPLSWDAVGDTAIKINLLHDYERNSINRQCTHFNFKIETEPGTKLNLIISGFRNIYNGRVQARYGRKGQPLAVFFSEDYVNWTGITSTNVENNLYDKQVKYTTKTGTVYVASLPVYSLSHLKAFKNRITLNPLIKIFEIGETVEKHPLEIIRLGNPTAKKIVLIRGRAHAWEPGGNWAIEGLIDNYLARAKDSDIANEICYYIMPMANKDMVIRGMTRFNTKGMDLNRGWGSMADSTLAPENFYFEKFLLKLIAQNNKPDFFIDFHNDNWGNLHVPQPKNGDMEFLPKIEEFYNLLNELTWFSSKMQHGKTVTPDRYNSATGLYRRFDIPGIIFEFNGDRIDKLDKIPEISDWKTMGAKLNEVFELYFNL